MATLSDFLGPHAGNMRIFIYMGPICPEVGSGSFTEVSDFVARFAGTYDYLSLKGKVNVAVELKDHDPKAPTGPCSITVMEKTDRAASYRVQGDKLVVTTTLNAKPIEVYVYKKGTEFDGPELPSPVGAVGVWIGP